MHPTVPVTLETCQPAPEQLGDGATQKDVARWATHLWHAHADCESKLRSLNRALAKTEE